MSETNYFRLIEAYFDGSIEPLQKAMLESKIQTDPLLKAEFDLQSNIIEGIADVRRQQLKERLSAIDVNGSGSLLLGNGVKWLAAGLSVAVIFSVWLYWYTNNPQSVKAIQLQSEDLLVWNEESYPSIPLVLDHNLPVDEDEEELKTSPKETIANTTAAKTEVIVKEEDNTAKSKPQALITFQDENLFSPSGEQDFSKTAGRDINRNVASETKIEFLEPFEDKKQYHYKYYNNKLYLFGDFNNEPYEILELHNNGKKQLFLSYQDTIYLIEAEKTDVTPLVELTDELLILELKMILNEE